jgi:hypothetical protein
LAAGGRWLVAVFSGMDEQGEGEDQEGGGGGFGEIGDGEVVHDELEAVGCVGVVRGAAGGGEGDGVDVGEIESDEGWREGVEGDGLLEFGGVFASSAGRFNGDVEVVVPGGGEVDGDEGEWRGERG